MLLGFYLSRHHFGVVSGYVDAGIEAAAVVAFHDVPAVDPVGPDAAVVRALGAWEAVLGPSEGVVVLVQQGVLLLDAKPRLEFLSPENSRIGLSTTGSLRSRD